jgi:hypothetical protein
LSESASVVVSMACTTLPKEDKAGTSSVEASMVEALVDRSRSKTSNDAPVDDNSELLNFVTVVSWIGCWMSLLP